MNKILYKFLAIGFFLFFGTTVNAQSTLNTFGFSNSDAKAAVAYSVRKLSTDYTGFAIQVRRGSDNTTQDIGFTTAGNLDTAALKTFVGSNNGFVTIWYDQSGNARNLTQTTAGSQPAIVNTGVIYRKSGSPTVFFDATDDGMLFTGTDYLTANGLAVNVVAGSNANDNLPRRAVQGTSNWVIGPHGNAHSWWAGDWNHQIATPWSTTLVERFTVIQTPTINTANTSFRNGTAVPCANNKSTQPGKLSLGASGGFAEPLNGFISEVVGFPYELLPSEIDLIENSQASYYTASITLGISNLKAATAYSLRKITADFAGFAIQVRRSSDNTTQDIGFTTTGDLDTAALKTFVGSNNGFVTIWYDQSGNARNLTQTTAGSQPAIINAGIIYRRSGSPTVFFDATDDGMLFTGTDYLTTNGLSVNVVAGSNANSSNSRRAVQGTSNWLIGPHGNFHSWWAGDWNHQIATPWSTTLVERFTVIQPTSNANTSFRNGIAVPSANNKSTQPGKLSVGASGGFAEPLNGFISEVVSYPTELTTTQTQSIETSQASYYSIQSTVAPTITSFTPLIAKPGDPVTLTGTGFNTIAANNIVFFGATRATVTAATATSVTVTVPTGANFAPITLLNTSNSFAAFSKANFTPIYSPAKTGITATDFQAKQDFATGSNPYFVAIGDLDGDGKPDLAVANYSSNTVSILRNTSSSGSIGVGSFATKVDFATEDDPISVAIGDLDGDGKPDLAVANYNSNTVSIYRNTATSGSITSGSFATKVDFTTGGYPRSVAIGDLDGDGKPDLAVANFGSISVSVLRNTATSGSITSGSFATKVDFTTGSIPRSVAIGDLDGDGKPDLAVANEGSNNVSVLRNTSSSGSISSGSFAAKVDFTTGVYPQSVAIGDLDGDGKPDLAVANESASVSVLRNTATSGSITSGSFADRVNFTTGSSPRSVAIGDLDVDGKPDLAVANAASNSVSIYRNTSSSGSITSGSFAAKVDFTTAGFPLSVAIGDLDGDGKPDLALANNFTPSVSVLRNTATSGSITSGSFAVKVDFAGSQRPLSVAIGDLDGDGKPDLAVANESSASVSVYHNTATSGSIGSGSFATRVDFTTGGTPWSVAIGDLDGDGKPDLAVANSSSDSVSVLRNTATSGSIGAGSFAAKVDFETGSSPFSVAIGDLDGDGKPDLAVTNRGSENVSVIRNTDFTTWNGSTWSNGTPNSTVNAIIASSTVPSASFSSYGLTINSGVALTTTGITATVNGNITNSGNGMAGTGSLTIAANSSISGNTINFNGTLTVNSGATLTTNDKFTLSSNAIATGSIGNSAGTINGNITLQRFIAGGASDGTPGRRGFRFLSHPFTNDLNLTPLRATGNIDITGAGGTTNGFDQTQTNNPSAFWYNSIATGADNANGGTGNDNGWVAYTSGNGIADGSNPNTWNRGQGIRVLFRGAKGEGLTYNGTNYTLSNVTLSMSGAVNMGNQTFTLPAGGNDQWSLVGNPYASPVNVRSLLATQRTSGLMVGATAYVFNPNKTGTTRGGYEALDISSAGNYALPANGVILVQHKQALASTINFAETDKTVGADVGFRTQVQGTTVGIDLVDAASQEILDEYNLRFSNTAQHGTIGDVEDGGKLLNNYSLYSISESDNKMLKIDSRPKPNTNQGTSKVRLGLHSSAAKALLLKVTDLNLPTGIVAYLKDNWLNQEQAITNSSYQYSFATTADTASKGNNRFELVFKQGVSLPVTFTQIKAQQQGNGSIQVSWQVANEVNISNYEVEESSNAQTFSKANSQTAENKISYNWLDNNIQQGNNFYRVRAVDKSGNYQYSQVVNVRIGKEQNSISIYPNPVKGGMVNVQFGNAAKGIYSLQLYNSIGQLVATKQIEHQGGNATQSLQLSNSLSQGSYKLVISNGEAVSINQTVIVE